MGTGQNRFYPLKTSIFTKASQFATSCGAEIAIILFREDKPAITFSSRNIDIQQITLNPGGLCIFKLKSPNVDLELRKRQNSPFNIEINNKGEIWWRKDIDTLDLAQLRLLGENLKTLKQKVINAIKEKQAATEASAKRAHLPQQSSSSFPYAGDLQAQPLNQTLQTSPSSLAATETSAETAQWPQPSSCYIPYAGDIQAQQLSQTLQTSPSYLAATEASAETAHWPQRYSSYLPYAGDLQAQPLNQTLQTSQSSLAATEASAETTPRPQQSSSYFPYAGDVQAQQLNQTLQTSPSSLAATEASADTAHWSQQYSSYLPYAGVLQAQQLNQTLQTSPSSLAATEAWADTAHWSQQSSYLPYAGDLQAQQLNQTLQTSPSLAATEASAETAHWSQQSFSYLPYAGDLQAQQLNQTLQTSPSSFASTSGTSQYDMVGRWDIHGKGKALANTSVDSRCPWVNRIQEPHFCRNFGNPSSSMFGSADPIRHSFGQFNRPVQQFTIPSMQQFNHGAAMQLQLNPTLQDGNYGVNRQFPGYEHAPNFSNVQPNSFCPPSAD